ncbi:MAG: hypothetical protein ACKO2K_01800 [Alphaproteobacteria bacterium]
MRDRSRAFARIGAALACAAIALAAAPSAHARESGFQIDGDYALVSKDVAGQRWAMTYDTASEVITGNVFPQDGGAPKFVVCDVVSVDAQGALVADCAGADACTSCPCSAGWTGLGTVNLPGNFFEFCGAAPQGADAEGAAETDDFGGSLGAPAAARESGFQSKGAYELVSKDVNGERWAMTYDTESGVITGNVFPQNGGAPQFVVCDVLSVDAQGALTADCSGADACTSCPCTQGFTGIGTVTLPAGFFESCDGGGSPVIDCPGGEAFVSGTIPSSQTWPSSCNVLLDGTVFVDAGVEVTIQAGTTIRARKNPSNPPPSALVFRRGARIVASGSANAPIVFTSDQAPGSRAPGDWGGLVLNGYAPTNCPGGECLAEGLSDSPFGGNDPNDSSGVLRYVRIEFAGRVLSTDNELNVLSLNAVGRGTQMDHVQTALGLDDGFEWFGGTVLGKYLVSGGSADDQFDLQIGTTAALQFGYASQYGGNLDSTGSHGIELDNNENGFDFEPRSNPHFCNVTVIGCKGQGGNCTVDSTGALLRRGTAGQFWKTIVTNMGSRGMQLRDAATAAVACNPGPTLTGNLMFRDSIFWDNGASGSTNCGNHSTTGPDANCNSCQLYDLWKANSPAPVFETDPGLSGSSWPANPFPNGNVNSSAIDCSALESSFQSTGYVGAFAPGGANWMDGWTSFAVN